MKKNRFSEKLLLSTGVLLALIFALDLSLPLGVAAGVPYVGPVLLSIWSPRKTFPVELAIAGSGLVMAGYLLSPPGGIPWVVIANRMLALFAIWITALLITQRKRFEEKLLGTNKSLAVTASMLKKANLELSEFAHVVSHDLKAPLRAIHNYSDFLREDLEGELDGEQKEYLDGMTAAVRQGEQLIDGLLTLSRLGRAGVTNQEIKTGDFLKEILISLNFPREVEVKMPDVWPDINMDPVIFRQIFQNLIGNAVKFNTSPVKEVELGWLQKEERRIEIFVRDNGIGIEPRFHKQIFGAFQRLHTDQEFEGTGIGLAVVKKGISKLNGLLRLESCSGKGSTFFVNLPVTEKGK